MSKTERKPDIEAACGQLTETWNREIRANRVRVMTLERRRAVRMVLRELSVEQVCQAMACYGRQKWQRANGAWKRFDAFLDPTVCVQWYEQSCDEADATSGQQRRAATAQRAEAQRQAAIEAERKAATDRQAAWAALDGETKRTFIQQARDRLPGRSSAQAIDYAAMMAWAAQGAHE